MNPYIGHESQMSGIEEHRLSGGKGDGMRLLEVNNGQGLEMTVVPDRAADIARLRFQGMNMGYFSPCGYVAPSYYDSMDDHWLKSFTAGFLTTCGLEAVGTPCIDQGEKLPLHGSIGNTPAEQIYWRTEEHCLLIHALMKDEFMFGRNLRMEREYEISLDENIIQITDTVENAGSRTEPIEILYHMNMGYPLLDEDSILTIPAKETKARDEHAKEDIQNWMKMEKPQAGYVERCYYHTLEQGRVSIYQPKIKKGLQIEFDTKTLDCFVEWKMMGIRDYVLGLECGNCLPDGRDVMRKAGRLKFIEPGEKAQYRVKVTLHEQ